MKRILLALLLTLPFAAAKADVYETYNLHWSSASSSATISATVTLDMTILGSSGNRFSNMNDGVIQSFNMTVSGTMGGDGSFTSSDYYGYNWYKRGDEGITLKSPSQGSIKVFDFNFFASSPYAPNAMGPLVLGTADGGAFTLDAITASGVAPVPEPSSWVLGLGGLMGMTVLASRKKKTATLKAPALLA